MTWKDIISSLRGKSELPPLPESFLFGVATADHQCEAYDPNYVDIRDVWERVHHPEAARRKAADFWNRYEEDIDRARDLGCTAFRFSTAWSRLEPEPAQFNQAAFDHYQDLIERIISSGMKPILTLHHFTWPLHVERAGGMIGDQFPAIYARYVKEVARRFGPGVPYWITFNEPNLLMGGYLKPWWDTDYAAPPGLEGADSVEQVEAVGKLICNLFLANKEAYDIIKKANPEAKVGANAYFYGLPGWLQSFVNRSASSIKGPEDLIKQRDRLVQRRALIRGSRISKLRANLLERDKVDVVMAALTRTPEREQQVDFSEAYFVTGIQLMVPSSSSASRTEDLDGKVIAVVKGTTAEQDFSALAKESRPLVVPHYETALQALDQGHAEALISDNAILHGLMMQYPGKYKLIDEMLTDNELYAAAVTRGESDLLNALDQTVRDFKKSPEWLRWAGRSVRKPPRAMRALDISRSSIERSSKLRKTLVGPLPRAQAGTALRRIQDRGYIVAAVKPSLPGFSYHDPDTGEFSGLEIDLARALARRIFDDGDPGRVRFYPAATQVRIPLMKSAGLLDDLQKLYSILTTMIASNWWYLGMAGDLDQSLCPKQCVGKFDFVGLDYYWGVSTLQLDRIMALMNAAYRKFDKAPVWPGGINNLLKDLGRQFPDKPLMVVENGSVEEADGIDRATYIIEHIEEVQRAVNSGTKVEGYICWAITSNREWDLKFEGCSDFGLFHINLDSDPSLRRTLTPAADTYKDAIRKRGG